MLAEAFEQHGVPLFIQPSINRLAARQEMLAGVCAPRSRFCPTLLKAKGRNVK
jgi:hypothetical protein